MKRTSRLINLAGLLVLIVAAFMLPGCGPKEDPNATPATPMEGSKTAPGMSGKPATEQSKPTTELTK